MIPMYVWLRWKLGHGEFKPYGRSNPAVRPHIGIGGPGEQPVPVRWWNELKARWWSRNPTLEEMQDTMTLWRQVGVWTAWGWGNGQFCDRDKVMAGTMTADDLRPTILKFQARGAKWIGVQDLPATRAIKSALKTVCRQQGLKLVVWHRPMRPDVTLVRELLAYWQPDGYAANIEDDGVWGGFAWDVAQNHPLLPRAVWTNFAGAGAMPDGTYSEAAAKDWWGNGFACVTEAYVCQDPGARPLELEATALNKLKYPAGTIYPSIGIYRGWSVEDYEQMLAAAGRSSSYSIYLGEYLPELN